jgi:hypothetical protein
VAESSPEIDQRTVSNVIVIGQSLHGVHVSQKAIDMMKFIVRCIVLWTEMSVIQAYIHEVVANWLADTPRDHAGCPGLTVYAVSE